MKLHKRVFIVSLISFLALLPLSGHTGSEIDVTVAKEFSSYGFGYVKVTNIKTKKSFYLVDTQIHTHCCGDVALYTKYINYISTAARKYIEETLNASPEAYNLNPTFTKCLKSAGEAEEIRSKKVSYFGKLGHKALEMDMQLPDTDCTR